MSHYKWYQSNLEIPCGTVALHDVALTKTSGICKGGDCNTPFSHWEDKYSTLSRRIIKALMGAKNHISSLLSEPRLYK
jgi:hypothetical protein